jgi:hypothetical protein
MVLKMDFAHFPTLAVTQSVLTHSSGFMMSDQIKMTKYFEFGVQTRKVSEISENSYDGPSQFSVQAESWSGDQYVRLSDEGEIIVFEVMEDDFEIQSQTVASADPTRTSISALTINEHFVTGSPTRTSSQGIKNAGLLSVYYSLTPLVQIEGDL